MTVLTAGVGLKPEHFDDALRCRAEGMFFEVHAENYTVAGGPRRSWLEAVRREHPLSLHGVSLSLAGSEPTDAVALAGIARLVRDMEPALVSEHLAWSRFDGAYFPDLLPFPRTTEALDVLCGNVSRVQDALGRTLAIENPSHYLLIDGHDYDEIEFLSAMVRRTGCTLLLDINNVHVSAVNSGSSAERYIDAFPALAVVEVHLAGHRPDPLHGEALLIDSHDRAVAPAVWSLFERFVARAGPRPTLIERDADLPAFDILMTERDRAHRLLREPRRAVA